jgi:hypothetical protein
VLVVAQRPSDFVEMRRCAVALAGRGWTLQMLYFCLGQGAAGEREVFGEIERLRAEGVLSDAEYFNDPSATCEAVPRGQRGRRRDRVHFLLRPPFILASDLYYAVKGTNLLYRPMSTIRSALVVIGSYLNNRSRIGALLDRLQPDAIVLPEDVVGLVTPLVIQAGHHRQIPSVILPYTIANQQEAFRSLSGHPSYQYRHWANRIAGTLFPRWVMSQEGHALVRLPAPHILGHVITQTVPPDPWMMNSGSADMVAVESEAMHRYYRAAGIPENKLAVVGAIYDDHLAGYGLRRSEASAELRRELGIAGEKPLLVVGGCPDQSHNSPPGFEFADMEDFCRRLGQALLALSDDYEILVRPHPNYARMGETLAEAGLRATTIDTARLVALADVYIAFASATIRWSIASGVPTINYDVFHYDYDDYRGVEGVEHVSTFVDFCERLELLRQGSPTLTRLQEAIRRSRHYWGRLDGQSTERIARLIDGLCGGEAAARTLPGAWCDPGRETGPSSSVAACGHQSVKTE